MSPSKRKNPGSQYFDLSEDSEQKSKMPDPLVLRDAAESPSSTQLPTDHLPETEPLSRQAAIGDEAQW